MKYNAALREWVVNTVKRITQHIFCTAYIFCFVLVLSSCAVQDLDVTQEEGRISFISSNGDKINAYLHLPPEVQPPYPVVIDLHGCNGIWEKRNEHWLPLLHGEGFAVLQVDSFRPRGVDNICSDVFRVAPIIRTMDANAAIRWVLTEKRFDANNIFMTGMSHGGTTILLTNMHRSSVFSKLKGMIAYYPYCLNMLPVLNSDLLVLVGGKDAWTPASRCRVMDVLNESTHNFNLTIYPDAYHTFDVPGINEIYHGYRVKYDKQAAENSILRVKIFLRSRKQ